MININGKKFKTTKLNFNQLDKLLDQFPKFISLVQSEAFDFSQPSHLIMAISQLMGDRPFARLGAILIVAEEKSFWTPEDFESNLEFTGQLGIEDVLSFEDGKVAAGELFANFLESNPMLGQLLDIFNHSSNSDQPTQNEPDSADTTKVSSTSIGS